MLQAQLHVEQEKACVIDEFADRFDSPFEVTIEALHDSLVTFVIRIERPREAHRTFFVESAQVERVEELDGSTYLVVKESCGAYHAVKQNQCVLSREASITRNRRVYTVLCFRREDLRPVIDDFARLGNVSLRKVGGFDGPGSTLTDRQLEVITCAFEEGYFDWPRSTSSEELAEQLGISRATFHEHLRKAQSKLLADALSGENADSNWATLS